MVVVGLWLLLLLLVVVLAAVVIVVASVIDIVRLCSCYARSFVLLLCLS